MYIYLHTWYIHTFVSISAFAYSTTSNCFPSVQMRGRRKSGSQNLKNLASRRASPIRDLKIIVCCTSQQTFNIRHNDSEGMTLEYDCFRHSTAAEWTFELHEISWYFSWDAKAYGKARCANYHILQQLFGI